METLVFSFADTGEVVGMLLVPPCFEPNGAFHRAAEMMGLNTHRVEGEFEHHADFYLTGEMIMDTMRAALASLN